MKKTLFILPSRKYLRDEFFFLGSTKDFNSRLDFFREKKFYIDYLYPSRSILSFIKNIFKFNKKDYDIIIVEHAPSILAQLIILIKFGKVIYRSHNAEYLHRIDTFKAHLFLMKNKIPFKQREITMKNLLITFYRQFNKTLILFLNIFRFLFRDIFTSIFSSKVIANCEWEKKFYWEKMKTQKNCFYATPYIPYKNLQLLEVYEENLNKTRKENLVVVLGSSSPSPIAEHQLLEFLIFFRRIKNLKNKIFENYKFVITGKISKGIFWYMDKYKLLENNNLFYFFDKEMFTYNEDYQNELNNIKKFCDEKFILTNKDYHTFYKLIAKSRFSLILSNLGYGFKNKSLEVIKLKSRLILKKSLYNRYPKEMKHELISIEDNINVSELERIMFEYDNEQTFSIDKTNLIIKKDSIKNYSEIFEV